MTAAVAISRATIRQVLPLRRSIIFILIEVALGVILLAAAGALADESSLDLVLGMAMTMFFPVLVPIVSLIVSASVLGSERRDETLSFIVLRPLPRSMIGASKLTAAILVAGVLNAIGGVALGGAYGIVSGSWGLVIPLAVGAFLASAVYAAVFSPLGLLTDRVVLVGLAFVFIFENGVVSALPGLATLSPWRVGVEAFAGMATSVATHETVAAALGNLTPGIGGALVKVVAVCFISVLVMTLLLRRRDLA
jgi:ABC-2 type transport system permease protein